VPGKTEIGRCTHAGRDVPYQLWISSTHDQGVPRSRTNITPFVSGPFIKADEFGKPAETWYLFNPHYEILALARDLAGELDTDEGNDFAFALPVVLARTAWEVAEQLFKRHFREHWPAKKAKKHSPEFVPEIVMKATHAGVAFDNDIDWDTVARDLAELQMMRNDIVHANYVDTYETGVGVHSRNGVQLDMMFVHQTVEAAQLWIDLLQAWYLALKNEHPQIVKRWPIRTT